MENTREKLIERFREIDAERDEINKQLRAIDVNETIRLNSKYIGKYYTEVQRPSMKFDEHITCIYVYGIDETNHRPMALEVSYWVGEREISYFSIEHTSMFDPNCPYTESKWKLISKKEFQKHFNNVQELISLSLKNVTQLSK